MGFVQAKSMQELEVLSFVVSSAFGGGKEASQKAQTSAEIKAQFKDVFGKGRT